MCFLGCYLLCLFLGVCLFCLWCLGIAAKTVLDVMRLIVNVRIPVCLLCTISWGGFYWIIVYLWFVN